MVATIYPMINPQTAVASPVIKYAGFLVRVAAALVDGLVLGVLQLVMVLFLGEGILEKVLATIAGWIYVVVMITNYRATLGKMAVGLHVERSNGESIGWRRAMLREIIGKLLSVITLGIGYLMVAWTKQKQGLHDKVADTVVVENDPHKSKTVWVVLAICVCAIPVLGIISAIVLASLNTARMEATDARVRSDLSTLPLKAEVYANANESERYSGFCNSPEALAIFVDAVKARGVSGADGSTSTYVCNDSNEAWAASLPIRDPDYACVDSKGGSVMDITSPLANGQISCNP